MKDGFLNVLKPPGMSSHDVVGAVRKILAMKRVGHAGTLDPAAAGVLPVAVGRAARLTEYLSLADKSYRAEITLGFATDSGDDTGRVISAAENFSMPPAEKIKSVLAEFVGNIRQIPPAYSAIKINGKKAYKLARKNIPVEVTPREVTIFRIVLVAARKNNFLIDVDCSKGTYVRSLASDIGEKLGVPSVMSFLVRTRVGDFSLGDAHTIEELASIGEAAVTSPEKYLSHMARYDLAPHRIKAFANGLCTSERRRDDLPDEFAVYGAGKFIGIGRFDKDERAVYPVKVY